MDNIVNVVTVIIITLLISADLIYIYKKKKKGVKCIGCPFAGNCSGHSHC